MASSDASDGRAEHLGDERAADTHFCPSTDRRWRRGEAGEIRAETGLDAKQFEIGISALWDADPPHLIVEPRGGDESYVDRVCERGRRELGSWPSADSILEQLVAAFAAEAEAETEPERRSWLQTTAATLGGIARDVAVNVISARIGQQL